MEEAPSEGIVRVLILLFLFDRYYLESREGTNRIDDCLLFNQESYWLTVILPPLLLLV